MTETTTVPSVYRVGNCEIQISFHERVWQPSNFTLWLGEHISQAKMSGTTVLDMGVGSGFLSIVAAKAGAERVVGLDLNPEAVTEAQKNWQANGLDDAKLATMVSDRFHALPEAAYEQFDLLVSNPPTAPELKTSGVDGKTSAWLWNENGEDGRLVLDALLEEGHKYLRTGGEMIFICTSKQGMRKTEEMLQENFSSHEVVDTRDLELAPYYNEYLPLWQAMEQRDGEQRLFVRDGKIYQRLYLIRAVK